MKISELIDHLTDAMENNGDREVLVAYQPNWPLAASVANVYDPADDDEPAEDDEDGESLSDRDAGVLWLAASTNAGYDQNPYAPRSAWTNERY
jgi:hypothetical protein